MTTSESIVRGHAAPTGLETAGPLPRPVCWLIWALTAVSLWGIVLAPFLIYS
jgi:hypothetical protein